MTFLDVLGLSFLAFCFYAAGSGGGGGQRSKSSHRHGDLEYRGISKLIKKMIRKRRFDKYK